MSWYITVLKRYFEFGGRSRRKEYWMFILFNMIFAIVLSVLDGILGTGIEGLGSGILYILYMLAVIIPSTAVFVRRLHDTGRSGWWFFIALIPLVGGIWLLVLLLMDSEHGQNQYGANPKETNFIAY